jgi:hypothetical protein
MAGMATMTNGHRQPNHGPMYPATPCPAAMPIPTATWTTADTNDRCSCSYMSLSRLNINGKHPPMEMPVSRRSTNSCQYRVTKMVRMHGPSPSSTAITNSSRRLT